MNRRGFLGRLVAAPVAGLVAWKVAPVVTPPPVVLTEAAMREFLEEALRWHEQPPYRQVILASDRWYRSMGVEPPLDGLTFRS